jgi:beta-ureidopropionase / N-carbamoyl-L-amino-acid hydrolase
MKFLKGRQGMSSRIERRELLRDLMGAGALCAAAPVWPARFWPILDAPQQNDAELRIDAARLQKRLEELSMFGRPAGGTFADGVSRVAYSDADVAGRKYAMEQMRTAGLEPRIDAAGNIFGARAGADASLPRILFGSHIDSVPNGGNFDGDVGSMSAIEVMQTLKDRGVTTRHPLEMVMWSNEEGGIIGSSAAAGELPESALRRSINGYVVGAGMKKIGGDPARLAEAKIAKGSFRCYLELHIEQGGNLEKAGVPVGVVEGIVSIDEYEAEIRGFANHAGTTPMPERRNALLAAAKLIIAVQEEVTREPGRQVGNVGEIHVTPNARNVVPGYVKHTIELRDLDSDKIARIGQAIQKRAQEIARETNTEISIKQVEHDPAAVATPEIQATIEHAAAGLGLKTMRLPSGAGHDAQMMARVGPMGMIFVPSHAGISHSPHELTAWQDCANGANVLLQAILLMDAS